MNELEWHRQLRDLRQSRGERRMPGHHRVDHGDQLLAAQAARGHQHCGLRIVGEIPCGIGRFEHPRCDGR